MLYCDGSATTKPSELAVKTFVDVCRNNWGNPSSTVYDIGNDARSALEAARKKIAKYINAEPEQVFFTSGATEGANWVIQTIASPNGAIICSQIEHPCVYNTALAMQLLRRSRMLVLDNDRAGRVSLASLKRCLYYLDKQFSSPNLVCVMGANNEVGTRQSIQSIAEEIHRHRNVFLLSDMTQQFAHYPDRDVKKYGFDFAIASAQKFGGLKGCGFLYAKEPDRLKPFIYGGHQERGLRAGTENVAGAVSTAEQFEAMCMRSEDDYAQLVALRSMFVSAVRERGWTINGDTLFVLPNIVSVTVPRLDANRAIAALALDGIYVSAGSACSTGENKPSRILKALGLKDDEARSTLRISLYPEMTEDDVEYLVERIENVWQMIKTEE